MHERHKGKDHAIDRVSLTFLFVPLVPFRGYCFLALSFRD